MFTISFALLPALKGSMFILIFLFQFRYTIEAHAHPNPAISSPNTKELQTNLNFATSSPNTKELQRKELNAYPNFIIYSP
jgi:hypothetical protein